MYQDSVFAVYRQKALSIQSTKSIRTHIVHLDPSKYVKQLYFQLFLHTDMHKNIYLRILYKINYLSTINYAIIISNDWIVRYKSINKSVKIFFGVFFI